MNGLMQETDDQNCALTKIIYNFVVTCDDVAEIRYSLLTSNNFGLRYYLAIYGVAQII